MTPRRGVRLAALAALGGVGIAGVLAGVALLHAGAMPEDAPLARMYRGEATLTTLGNAVRAYHQRHGVWPPRGHEGLAAALRDFSARADYYPEGVPSDPWGGSWVYVPAPAYAAAPDLVLRDAAGRPFAPRTFQLYSRGSDGAAGPGDAAANADNLMSWDAGRSWRPVYRQRQRAHKPRASR